MASARPIAGPLGCAVARVPDSGGRVGCWSGRMDCCGARLGGSSGDSSSKWSRRSPRLDGVRNADEVAATQTSTLGRGAVGGGELGPGSGSSQPGWGP